jgi:GTP-binding protein LepA
LIGGKVIAHETIAAMRKDVTAKCTFCTSDGRMRECSSLSIPQEVFIAALRMGEE